MYNQDSYQLIATSLIKLELIIIYIVQDSESRLH
jgi:hypothetical protein